jgi:hypothetical protein
VKTFTRIRLCKVWGWGRALGNGALAQIPSPISSHGRGPAWIMTTRYSARHRRAHGTLSFFSGIRRGDAQDVAMAVNLSVTGRCLQMPRIRVCDAASDALSQALYSVVLRTTNSICKESPGLIQCESKRGSHWASRVAHYSWSIRMDVVRSTLFGTGTPQKEMGEVAQLLIGTEMRCEQPESSWKVHLVHTAAAAV